MDVISQLKALPFTLNEERDENGICLQVNEFPDAFEYETDYGGALHALAHSLKEWGRVTGSDIDGWRKGREEQIPYLLKILVSSEEELFQCLRRAKCVNSCCLAQDAQTDAYHTGGVQRGCVTRTN